jgi:hypothetical protein
MTGPLLGTQIFTARFAGPKGLLMQEEKPKVTSSRESRDKRKAETDRAYREMEEKDRRERLEKTMRLRKMRLVKDPQSE